MEIGPPWDTSQECRMATTSSSLASGAAGAHAGIADPGLSASVLIGGCVAFWRIGLVRLSSKGIGYTACTLLPALVSAAPAAVFHAARLAGVFLNTMKSVPDSHAVPSGGRRRN